MPLPPRIPALVSACTLAVAGASSALPVSALAQSGGDEQYQNPFPNDSGSGNSGSGSGNSSSGSSGSSNSGSGSSGSGSSGSGAGGSGSNAPSISSGPPGGSTSSSGSTSGTGSTLPNTGADAWLTALFGAGLLMTGAGLRVRLRELD